MADGREESSTSSHPPITDTSAMQSATTSAAVTAELAKPNGEHHLTEEQDSDSDASSDMMDVSESDDEPEPEPATPMPPKPEPYAAAASGTQSAGTKRKMSDVITNGSSHPVHELPKKPRLSPPSSLQAAAAVVPPPPQQTSGPNSPSFHGLPTEIWQEIFLYLPPAILSRSLRVCKTFNSYLTGTRAQGQPARNDKDKKSKASTSSITVMDSNNIWANARKVWFPNMPRPLARCNELGMLQLISGLDCQFCHRTPAPSMATSVFNAGPGLDGLRVIWPFGVRACGRCLQANTMTDIGFLQTSAAILAPGLPYIFMTKDLHFIPEIQRQAPGGMPVQPGASISKAYYRGDMDLIVAEYENAKDLGAHEEWRKGLFTKGKEAMADAARWEKWEGQMRPGSDLVRTLREYDLSSFPNYLAEAQRKSAAIKSEPPATTANGTSPNHMLPPTPHFSQPVQAAPAAATTQQEPFHFPPMPPPAHSWTGQQHLPKPRNPQDVQERRQARRQEIERRCLELDPPLEADALPHMESFQAAIQIAQPLTDQAWEMLKSRFLAQREAAELTVHENAQNRVYLEASRLYDKDFLPKQAKEIYDKDYQLAQAPLRMRLEEYVDEHVNRQWHGRTHFDCDTTPIFAATAILHVYQRYKEDEAAGALPPPGLVPKKRRDTSPVQDPFLSLDNMKHVFENKIRAYLDPNVKEQYLCAGCLEDSPQSLTWKLFDGLIQHYAAKHTTAFSKGNSTVWWETSAWPEDPPFHPHPEKWIKPTARKSANRTGRGNAKRTPQPRRDGMFDTPGASNGYYPNQQGPYANGYYGGAQGYPSHSYGQSDHQAAQYGQYQGTLPPPSGKPEEDAEFMDSNMINQFAADVREIWDAFEGVPEKDLLNCIRLHTVLHHANTRFLEKFGIVPTLDHVTDALATNPAMQPIKAATGLACKVCVANHPEGPVNYQNHYSHQSYYSRIMTVKLHTTNSLINHFKIMHMPNMPFSVWMRDMLQLPEAQLIKDVARAPGMDDVKLGLIAAAFPEAFPYPNVKVQDFQQNTLQGGAAVRGAGVASKLIERSNKGPKPQTQGKKKGKGRGSSGTPAREGSHEGPLPEPQEHEYDPRKPLASKDQDEEDDAAKYDTDLARKKASASAAPAAPNCFNLDADTLRMLQTLPLQTLGSAQPAQPAPISNGRIERAPSVGRNDYPAAAPAPAPAPAPPSSSNGTAQVDIAAILASLTGGAAQTPQQPPQQVTTPTGRGSSRDVSVSRSTQRGPAVDPLYRSLSTSYSHDRPNAYPAYAPPPQHQQAPVQSQPAQYRPSAEPPTPSPRYEMPGSDLQAALERNARHFSQNQAQPPQHVQPQQTPQTYTPAPAYAQASPPQPQHVSPPRYYVYDDGYAQGHGQPAPVQYIQRPQQQQGHPSASGYHAQGYPPQHQHQPPRYVDEHGRELIPVDSAPTHVQYAPQLQPQQVQYAGHGGGYGGHGGYYEQHPQVQAQDQGYYGGVGGYNGGR